MKVWVAVGRRGTLKLFWGEFIFTCSEDQSLSILNADKINCCYELKLQMIILHTHFHCYTRS